MISSRAMPAPLSLISACRRSQPPSGPPRLADPSGAARGAPGRQVLRGCLGRVTGPGSGTRLVSGRRRRDARGMNVLDPSGRLDRPVRARVVFATAPRGLAGPNGVGRGHYPQGNTYQPPCTKRHPASSRRCSHSGSGASPARLTLRDDRGGSSSLPADTAFGSPGTALAMAVLMDPRRPGPN